MGGPNGVAMFRHFGVAVFARCCGGKVLIIGDTQAHDPEALWRTLDRRRSYHVETCLR